MEANRRMNHAYRHVSASAIRKTKQYKYNCNDLAVLELFLTTLEPQQ